MNGLSYRLAKLLLSLLLVTLLAACLALPSQNQPTVVKNTTTEATPMTTDPIKILNIAHRGARSLAPENTLPAARKALEVGADGWELDVAMSLDGELVVLHDDTLERTSNAAKVFRDRRPWSVYDFSLADLRSLDFGGWFIKEDPFKQIAKGNVSAAELESIAGTQIPTLREALVFTKENHWWVNIEIKDASGAAADTVIVKQVVALVEELELQDQVLISSFNHDYLRQVKALQPNLATGALVSKTVQDPPALLSELNANAFHPSLKTLKPGQVQMLRQAGYAVNVWTVNSEKDMRKAIEMGVDGIITDFPQLLKIILAF